MGSAATSHFPVNEISTLGQGWLKAAPLRAAYVLARIRPCLAIPSLRVHRTPTVNPLRRSDAASHLVQQARRRRTRRGRASPPPRNGFSDDIFETDRSALLVGIPRLRSWLRARHIRGGRTALSRVDCRTLDCPRHRSPSDVAEHSGGPRQGDPLLSDS